MRKGGGREGGMLTSMGSTSFFTFFFNNCFIAWRSTISRYLQRSSPVLAMSIVAEITANCAKAYSLSSLEATVPPFDDFFRVSLILVVLLTCDYDTTN